jgi:hypothetical protein
LQYHTILGDSASVIQFPAPPPDSLTQNMLDKAIIRSTLSLSFS